MRVVVDIAASRRVEIGGNLSVDDDREKLMQSGRVANNEMIQVTRFQQ